MTLSPTSPSTPLSFSSFLLSSCTSYCLSPYSSLMSWTTTTRTAAEELGHPDYKNSSTECRKVDNIVCHSSSLLVTVYSSCPQVECGILFARPSVFRGVAFLYGPGARLDFLRYWKVDEACKTDLSGLKAFSKVNTTVIDPYCPLECVVAGNPTLEESNLRQKGDDPKTDQTRGVDSNLQG